MIQFRVQSRARVRLGTRGRYSPSPEGAPGPCGGKQAESSSAGMRSRATLGGLRLRLRLRVAISAPAPAPAPSKMSRRLRLRLRLRAKCTGSGGSGSGSRSSSVHPKRDLSTFKKMASVGYTVIRYWCKQCYDLTDCELNIAMTKRE